MDSKTAKITAARMQMKLHRLGIVDSRKNSTPVDFSSGSNMQSSLRQAHKKWRNAYAMLSHNQVPESAAALIRAGKVRDSHPAHLREMDRQFKALASAASEVFTIAGVRQP